MMFFFKDTATTEIYTLSLHDALPISYRALRVARADATPLPGFDENAWVPAANFEARSLESLARELEAVRRATVAFFETDRKSTRLNSSHANISYAVFCLKKKKNQSTT